MAAPDGLESSRINFGEGTAAAQKAQKKSKERRKHRKGRQPPPGADASMPLFGALTMAPLAQVLKDGGTQPPTADEVALVFTPIVAQHLFGDPVGPGGQTSDGFNQPILLEFPALDPPVTSKCNCVEWEELKADFAADFRRLSQADFNRMELSRAGDKAVAQGDVAAMAVANGIYTSSFHSLKGSYQELLLQKEKAKKRASAGGSVAGGDAAASSLVFELADLLFKVFREQWHRFKAQRQEVLLSIKGSNSADAEAEAEKEKSEEAKRKNKPKKGEVRKYYAVAVGRKTGVFTSWDEADRSVHKFQGCVFKSLVTTAVYVLYDPGSIPGSALPPSGY